MPTFFNTQMERWVAVPGGPPSPVTLDLFVSHARRFGVECVLETATEFGLDHRDRLRLRVECDALEAKRRWVGKRRRRVAEDTEIMARYLRAEGFVVGVIAEKLGISEAHVRRCLRGDQQVPDSQKNGRKPFIHAADSALKSEARVTVA